jgi:hypothetical protein
MTRDLHKGFREPVYVPAGDMLRFLEEADRLPGLRGTAGDAGRAGPAAGDARARRRLALCELDYGATILAPPSDAVEQTLLASLPQPLAGRRLPGLLTEKGMRGVEATPFAFTAVVTTAVK